MPWYHLSFRSNLTMVVKTDRPTDSAFLHPSVPAWIKELKPEDIHREPDEPPRVCVAPSVWQCVAGFGRSEGNPTGNVYIYEVKTEEVEPRSFNNVETAITDEQWVTDNILDKYDGSIELRQIGFMEIDEIFIELKKNYRPDNVLEKMKNINEVEQIWSINGDKISERQWTLNNVRLADIRDN